jgi:hypothetical protein
MKKSLIFLTEYQLIKEVYGTKTTERSKVPLINHINEGCEILETINAPIEAVKAFCLHPLFQEDSAMCETLYHYIHRLIDPSPIVLAMEYRRVANNYLSYHCKSIDDQIELSILREVNMMLYADKIQNEKDFSLYHKGSHPNSLLLSNYFHNWINKLHACLHNDFNKL